MCSLLRYFAVLHKHKFLVCIDGCDKQQDEWVTFVLCRLQVIARLMKFQLPGRDLRTARQEWHKDTFYKAPAIAGPLAFASREHNALVIELAQKLGIGRRFSGFVNPLCERETAERVFYPPRRLKRDIFADGAGECLEVRKRLKNGF